MTALGKRALEYSRHPTNAVVAHIHRYDGLGKKTKIVRPQRKEQTQNDIPDQPIPSYDPHTNTTALEKQRKLYDGNGDFLRY